MTEEHIEIKGVLVRLAKIGKENYASLTDIARNYGEPSTVIGNWLRSRNTLEYLGLWEQLENDDFNSLEFEGIKNKAGLNSFYISPTQWIKRTNAIGIKAGRGRYSKGVLAQEDIALHFCYWLEPTFQLYMTREFKRLKLQEQLKLGDPFNIKRYLTSGNYSLLVHSVLSQMDERLLTHPQPYKQRLPFAAEADMINTIVFGTTAQEWRRHNSDKPINRNQRDYATVLDLTILGNLESLDSMLIRWGCDQEERQRFLQEMYDFQYPILQDSATIKKLQRLADGLEE